ncbi:MAG: hypothetical protein ABH986_05860 [archaeon]
MASLTDEFSLIVKKSFNWMLWLYLFAVSIAGGIVIVFSFIVFLLLALIVLLSLGFSSLLAWILCLILFILFLLAAFFVSAALQGASLNISMEFLEKGRLDFWSAWGKTKPRIMTAFKVDLIVSVFFLIVFFACFLPFIFSLMNFFASLNLTDFLFAGPGDFLRVFAPLIVSFLISLLVFIVISIILLPFSVIYKQVPFFESLPATDSINRAIFLAKKNYLKNLAFYFIFFVFIMVVSLVFAFVIGIFTVAMVSGIVWLVLLLIFLRVIIQVIFSVWVSAFSFLFETKIYQINVEGEKQRKTIEPKTSVKKRSRPSAKKRKK